MMRTQIFGAAASTPAPVPNTTQTFGAAIEAGGVPNTTQTFGAVGAGGGVVPNTTQTFGAATPGGGAVSNTTQTFGAVGMGGAAAPNATQTFGTVGAGGGAVSNTPPTFGEIDRTVPNTTQTFGAVGAGGGVVPNATQTFGAVAPVSGAPATGHGAASPASPMVSNATQSFGAVPPVAVPQVQSVGRQATPSFGRGAAASVPTPPAVAPLTPQLGGEDTQAARPVGSDVPAPLGRSQTFSAVPSSGASAPVGSTRLFGAVAAIQGGPEQGPTLSLPPDEGAATRGGAPEPLAFPRPDGSAPDPVNRKTALFGVSSGSAGGGLELPPESPLASPLRGASAGPEAASPATPAAPRRAAVSLPPELLAASRMEGSAATKKAGEGGSRNLLYGALIGLGVILAGVLAYPAWRDRSLDVPPAAVSEKDRAVATLRRDDAPSRDQVIENLEALSTAHPRYVEAQAELVVALALRLADLEAESESLRESDARLRLEIATLQRAQEPADWARRVSENEAELVDISRLRAPLRARAEEARKALDARVAPLLKDPEVQPASALAARVKARAMYAAVTAAPNALSLAEWLRNVESGARPWSTLARAEYALSAGSPPDSLLDAAKGLEALRQDDRTLLRAYVLGARLAIRRKDPETARSLLDDVVALNPNHELARKLLQDLPPPEPTPTP